MNRKKLLIVSGSLSVLLIIMSSQHTNAAPPLTISQLEKKLGQALGKGDIAAADKIKREIKQQQTINDSTNKKITISVEIEGAKPLKIQGTKTQVNAKILKLEREAIALVQKAVASDSCRVSVCKKIDKDEKSGNSIERPLTDTEITIQESKALIQAIKKVELVKLAQKQNSGVQMVIPISVDGVRSTISGTSAQIAVKLTELQTKAVEKQIDPCAAGGCTKVEVNASTGVTTVSPLSAADLAQRAKDIEDRSISARKTLAAAVSAEAEPSLTLSVQLPNQSFGTSGTRSQLEEFVKGLESRAATYSNSEDPCAAGGCTKVEVNASTGVTTVSPLSAADLAQRATDRAAEASRSASAASAARESLANAEPTLTLSVQLPNQGFGTSGTRSQLEQVVRDLESRSAAAAAQAAADPCAGGCAPGISVNASTGVVTIVPVSPEQIAQRSADAVASANRAAELAAAARETLNALP